MIQKSSEPRLITIHKILHLSSSHKLFFPYESKCNQIHGHNFKIEIWIKGYIDKFGVVVDFYRIKKEVMNLDHQNINDIIEIPTAENIALYLIEKLHSLAPEQIKKIKIRVWETDSAYAQCKIEY